MLKAEQVGENDWEFVYPPKYKQLMDKFGEGIDLWEMGHTRSAEKTYKEIIDEFPGFIDVYHHLGRPYGETARERKAFSGRHREKAREST